MARLKAVEQLSINDIEKLLKNRRSRLKTLERKKGNLLKQVGSLDNEISRIHGSLVKGKMDGLIGRVRTLPKNDKNCRLYIVDVLAKSKKAMRPKEIAEAVLAAGYKSNSERFSVIVNQNLMSMKKTGQVIHDEANSSYRLVKGKGSAE